MLKKLRNFMINKLVFNQLWAASVKKCVWKRNNYAFQWSKRSCSNNATMRLRSLYSLKDLKSMVNLSTMIMEFNQIQLYIKWMVAMIFSNPRNKFSVYRLIKMMMTTFQFFKLKRKILLCQIVETIRKEPGGVPKVPSIFQT